MERLVVVLREMRGTSISFDVVPDGDGTVRQVGLESSGR